MDLDPFIHQFDKRLGVLNREGIYYPKQGLNVLLKQSCLLFWYHVGPHHINDVHYSEPDLHRVRLATPVIVEIFLKTLSLSSSQPR